MRRLLLLLSFLLPAFCFAQLYQVSGTVTNGENDELVEGASIFINNASGGTVTAKDGSFTLSGIPFTKFELVISHVAFETLVVPITPENIGKKFKIQLAPKQAELQEVVVGPVEKRGWEKWGNLFTQTFIGTSELAQSCIIKNPEVLRFRYNQNTEQLKVVGTDKLIIENKKLGYIIGYQLEDFMYDRRQGMTSYFGYTSFTPMTSKHQRKITEWKKARLEAYNGSIMHFMRSIYTNNIVADSFELRSLQRIYKKDTATRALYDSLMHGRVSSIDTARFSVQLMKPSNGLGAPIVYIIGRQILPADSIRRYDPVSKTTSLYFANSLMVRYKNELEKPAYATMRKQQKQHSILYFVKPEAVIVEASGLYYNPLNIFTEEYWAWEKTAETLPADYQPGD